MASSNVNDQRLTVAVRIRPLSEAERERKAFECVTLIDERRVLLVDPEKFENDILRQNRQHERQFLFDGAFGPGSTHAELHARTTAPLVDWVVRGFNATVFAYGPTGTGKTFTMVGTRQSPGLMTLLTRTLYEKITGERFTVYISLLEIYNEVIRDLLNPGSGALDLLEDDKGNVQVPGLSRIKAPNTNKIMQLLQEGNSRRTQEPTAANATSSRSHALLQVSLYRQQSATASTRIMGPTRPGQNNKLLAREQLHGKLFLIDLAGSERASHAQNQGQRQKEGAAINRSLLALGNVINALSSGGGTSGRYVNYRDSKLTRLLKDSLGGNSRTCMIAHVSPSSGNYDETFNTLTYANRAKSITNRLAPNHRPASADRSYSEALAELRREAQTAGRPVPHAASSQQLNQENVENGGINSRERFPPATAARGAPTHDSPAASRTRRWVINGTGAAPPPATTVPTNRANTIVNRNNNTSTSEDGQQQQASSGRRFTSLFDSLREQFLAGVERQQKLHDRLLRANQEAYEVEISRASKLGILKAWEEKQRQGNGNRISREERLTPEEEQRCGQIIERMRSEVEEHEKRLSQIMDTRQRIERAVHKGADSLDALEKRMVRLAKDPTQLQVVELIRRLAQNQAERTAIHSDLTMQGQRLRRQEDSLLKLQRYEQIADRLISDQHMDDDERERLRHEYRLIKRQLNLHLLPLLKPQDAPQHLPSWNSQMLAQQIARRHSGSPVALRKGVGQMGFGKTFAILPTNTEQQQKNMRGAKRTRELVPSDDIRLPGIQSAMANELPATNKTKSGGVDTQSEFGGTYHKPSSMALLSSHNSEDDEKEQIYHLPMIH